jgi:hypothetical protein
MSDLADEVLAYAKANDNLPMQANSGSLLDSLSSSIGSVADFGFNLQKLQYQTQAASNDNQLQALKASLGFKTAVTQANAQSTIAGFQAQGAINQAAKSAGLTSGQGLSLTTVALIIAGLYFYSKKS